MTAHSIGGDAEALAGARTGAGIGRWSPWLRIAAGVARLLARGSRRFGLGAGAVIGGRLIQLMVPNALSKLAAGRVVVLVSGTNGKSTTTHLLTAMLRTCTIVTTNADGANMTDGLAAALIRDPTARIAVLEIDEAYLPEVIARMEPAVVVLLNLTRDQLDRFGEVHHLVSRIRSAIRCATGTTVVGNADDPLIVSTAADHEPSRWVSAGCRWQQDSIACPRCGGPIRRDGPQWTCECGLVRPDPDWIVDRDTLTGRGSGPIRLRCPLPGRINRANTAMATAAAAELGMSAGAAVLAARSVSQINGRYAINHRGRHCIRLLLAKNPAGWSEMLDILAHSTADLVLAVNAREADGHDTSWLWDVPFEQLRGRTVVVSGERAGDAGLRLDYAGVPHRVVPDIAEALDTSPGNEIDLIANYTAFLAARRLLS